MKDGDKLQFVVWCKIYAPLDDGKMFFVKVEDWNRHLNQEIEKNFDRTEFKTLGKILGLEYSLSKNYFSINCAGSKYFNDSEYVIRGVKTDISRNEYIKSNYKNNKHKISAFVKYAHDYGYHGYGLGGEYNRRILPAIATFVYREPKENKIFPIFQDRPEYLLSKIDISYAYRWLGDFLSRNNIHDIFRQEKQNDDVHHAFIKAKEILGYQYQTNLGVTEYMNALNLIMDY